MEVTIMSETKNKKALAENLSASLDITKKSATEIIELVFDDIKETLGKGGKFEVKVRKARIGINPSTKEKINIEASKSASFKASKALKEIVK
jgi:DNA-binding protein HU-beta